MSVREYIGARYVPVFADPLEWDGTTAYEPLTVVYHQGNSYTSRQAVPVGIEITNTTYWALTGNYNAQIEQYRAEVTAFDGRITANTTAIYNTNQSLSQLQEEVAQHGQDIEAETTAREAADTALGGRIDAEATARETADTALGGRIDAEATARETADTALDTRVTANASAIATTQLHDTQMSGYNYVAIGDGFTVGTGATTEAARMPNVIATALGMTLFNYAVGGTGFYVESGSGNDNFTKQIEAATAAMSADEIANTKLVTIYGGYNDYQANVASSTPTWGSTCSYAVSCVQAASQAFPNARILVAPMNWKGYEFDNFALMWYSKLVDALQKANVARVAVVENAPFWILGMLSKFDSSSASVIYPNNSGYQDIAGCFLNALAGGSQTNTTSQSYPYQNATFDNRLVNATNGVVEMEIGEISVTNLTEDVVIATIPDRYIPQFTIEVPALLNFSHFGIVRARPNGTITINRANDASYTYPVTGDIFIPTLSWNMYAKKVYEDN